LTRPNSDGLGEGFGDGGGDVVLDGEDVFEGAVVGFGPGDVAVVRADQARGDADPCAVFAHAAVEYVGDTEGAGDVCDGNLFALVDEGRSGRWNAQAGDLGELVDEFFGHAVGEFSFFHSLSQVEKRQDGDGLLRLRGIGERGCEISIGAGVDEESGEEDEAERDGDGCGDEGFAARVESGWGRCILRIRADGGLVGEPGWNRIGLKIGRAVRGVEQGADGGDQLIAKPRDGGDVGGLPRVVAELTAERCDGLVDGVRRDGGIGPDAGEEVVDRDDLTGALGEREEQAEGAGLETEDFLGADDLAGGWIDGPVADAQGADATRCGGRGFHAARFQKDSGGFRRPSGLEGVHVGMVSLRGRDWKQYGTRRVKARSVHGGRCWKF